MGKRIIKNAVGDMLPSTVLGREKTGFTFPFDRWLSDELSNVVHNALSDNAVSETPIDADGAAWVRQEYIKGNLHWSRLWALVVFSHWIDTHLSNQGQSSA